MCSNSVSIIIEVIKKNRESNAGFLVSYPLPLPPTPSPCLLSPPPASYPFPLPPIPSPCLLSPPPASYPLPLPPTPLTQPLHPENEKQKTKTKQQQQKTMCCGIQVILNETLTPINIVAPLLGRYIVLFQNHLVNLRTTD